MVQRSFFAPIYQISSLTCKSDPHMHIQLVHGKGGVHGEMVLRNRQT
jgi:hypothetical protein